MEVEDAIDEGEGEEFGFARNYFLAKELGTPKGKKLRKKLSDINPVDEQVSLSVSVCVCAFVYIHNFVFSMWPVYRTKLVLLISIHLKFSGSYLVIEGLRM